MRNRLPAYLLQYFKIILSIIIFAFHRGGIELRLWRAIQEHRLHNSPAHLRRTSSTETDMDTNSIVVVECQRCKATRRTLSNNSSCSNNPTIVIRDQMNGDVAEYYGENGAVNLWLMRGWCTLQWMVSDITARSCQYVNFKIECFARLQYCKGAVTSTRLLSIDAFDRRRYFTSNGSISIDTEFNWCRLVNWWKLWFLVALKD